MLFLVQSGVACPVWRQVLEPVALFFVLGLPAWIPIYLGLKISSRQFEDTTKKLTF